jgi:hypothetical protein
MGTETIVLMGTETIVLMGTETTDILRENRERLKI